MRTLVPAAAKVPAGSSSHSPPISSMMGRSLAFWRGPLAQSATSRPPGFKRTQGVRDVLNVRAIGKRRVHHDSVKAPQSEALKKVAL